MELNPLAHQWLVQAALMEDIGRGDITSQAVIPAGTESQLTVTARQEMVVAGLPIAGFTFFNVNEMLIIEPLVEEGTLVSPGTALMRVSGDARSLLSAERTALNFLQRMCGVATLTRQYVKAVEGTKVQILDTRKTLPGYRELDKYAVRMGGGKNHRVRLDDGMLIKDNHIAIAGGVELAVQRAKIEATATMRVEVECDTLAQVKEAVEAGADMILLDNMSPPQLHEAVQLIAGRAVTEASGNINLATLRLVAETGVDYISVGKLTHSAPSVDIGMDFSA